jgi:asparagine synthase (glutamine-hydrolysing)
MCGVAGFVTTRPVQGSVVHLGGMTEALKHRGPDDFGFYHDEFAHLGHRRLSIVDLAGGHQPMADSSSGLTIVYNGELYNHGALRPALERAGCRFRTRSDTETILAAYKISGAACLDSFRGMYAFLIWDRERRRLFCARDRMGIKPLYYFWNGTLFAFASEIKALLKHPSIGAALEESAVPGILAYGYSSDDLTLFRGIRKLLPGHHLTLDLRAESPEPRIERYWDPPVPGAAAERRSDEDWIEETRRRLEEAVQTHLMSDVPLGVFLSGGLDSCTIAALVKRSTSGPVKTFAVGYDEARFSELTYAAHAARAIGTEHHETVLGASDFFAALPRLIWHEDEPIAWPSSISLHFVSRLAANEVKVVLTGEGSDELFAGYERYRWQRLNRLGAPAYRVIPGFARRRLRNWVGASRLLNSAWRRKLGHTALVRGDSFESLYLENFYCAFEGGEVRAPIHQRYREFFDAHPGASPLGRTLYADQKTYLVELLMKQDQMSMASSIESRVPFLDHLFVEFAARLPDRLRIRRSEQKYGLKRAVADLVPRDLIYRKKMGFPTPLRQWLLDRRAEPLFRLLQSPDAFIASCLDRAQVSPLIERHRSGREDATDRIWRLINLQVWGDIFLTGRGEASRTEGWWGQPAARIAHPAAS